MQGCILYSKCICLGCILNSKCTLCTYGGLYFSRKENLDKKGTRAAVGRLSNPDICKVVLLELLKNMYTFYQMGGKYAFFPQKFVCIYFCPPSLKQKNTPWSIFLFRPQEKKAQSKRQAPVLAKPAEKKKLIYFAVRDIPSILTRHGYILLVLGESIALHL